jgi:hypothetical protein
MTRREFPALKLDDVPDGIKELERTARLGLAVGQHDVRLGLSAQRVDV